MASIFKINPADVNATASKPEPCDVEKLIKEHLEPEVWIKHLKNDLMKFWDRKEAYNLDNGLFPHVQV
jgi:hypothetical protein